MKARTNDLLYMYVYTNMHIVSRKKLILTNQQGGRPFTPQTHSAAHAVCNIILTEEEKGCTTYLDHSKNTACSLNCHKAQRQLNYEYALHISA